MDEQRYTELKLEIKKLIIETLNIPDVKPEEVDDEAPLFGGNNKLTLDSVDAIEIIMAVQRQYNVRINDQNLARTIVSSIKDIADFIIKEKAGKP
jgi:acyl carrier protein